jgi:RNA polymerase sigma-70 factor (ECF subfamily)
MDDAEAAAIRRCQAGDKEAFGHLVRRYAGAASGSAGLLLGCPDEALDASQEAFVRAWRNIRRFDAGLPFYPWYARILRNVCLSRLRRRARRRTVELDDGWAAAPAASDPVLEAERNERRDRIVRAVQRLPFHHRDVILMNHFQGLAYKVIAEVLNIPIGTVMSRLHNARKALRDQLAGECP